MRIMMLDETGTLILDADVDTQKRRVTTLNLEENYPAVVAAFVGLSVLSGYVANEMQDRDLAELWKIGSKVDTAYETVVLPIEEHPQIQDLMKSFGGSLTAEGKVEWQPTLKPLLTNQDRATAMGLLPCSHYSLLVCVACYRELARFYMGSGILQMGWCATCLPGAFEAHVKEQAEMDRLVEAEEPDRSDRAEGTNRPDAPNCEGGCE